MSTFFTLRPQRPLTQSFGSVLAAAFVCATTGCGEGGADEPGRCGDGVVGSSEVCDDGADNGRGTRCNRECSGPTQHACDPLTDAQCSCPAGQERVGSACVDIDGCKDQPCFVGVACTDVAAPGTGFSCAACPAGYEGDGQTCTGIGSCADQPCFEGVQCSDVVEPSPGFRCGDCPAGYEGNGKTCTDVDGCEQQPCAAGVQCTDVAAPGLGFTCGACPAGSEGDGRTCTEIDGCADEPCFAGVQCTDVPAPGVGATCGACPAGYQGDGRTCTEIDGCADEPCFAGVQCTDVPAPGVGATCGACPAGYEGDGRNCRDIDGCAGQPCFAGVECTDVPAPGVGATCGACPAGYEGDGRTCRDINGCAGQPCFVGVQCTDVPAPGEGATCGACPAGYEGDGRSCTEIDGCAAKPCFAGVQCTDVPAPGVGATCDACPPGYEGDGRTCKDTDGCAGQPCFAGVQCTDVPAPGVGATCGACPVGYQGNGTWCSPRSCGDPNLSNGSSSCAQGTEFNDQCTFTCNVGYRLVGAASRTCQADGTWSGDETRCVPVVCEDPDVGHGSVVCNNGNAFSASCYLDCDDGWAVGPGQSGVYWARCTGAGTWSPAFARCTVCAQGFTGPNCEYSNQTTCSGHGTARYDGSCQCDSGFIGASCACSNQLTCNGHGVTDTSCGCTCFDNSFVGHFTGADCGACVLGWAGPSCLNSDADHDRFAPKAEGGDDCNDGDPAIHPGAVDQVGNGIDDNCDGIDGVDQDHDSEASTASGGLDCDDQNYYVNTQTQERLNRSDDNCNGAVDEDIDDDRDGYSDAIFGGSDCNDLDPAIRPDVPDAIGDGVDNNCDGMDGRDSDRDGHASIASGGDDCDDNGSDRYPGAEDRGQMTYSTKTIKSWQNGSSWSSDTHTLENAIAVAVGSDGKPHALGRLYEFRDGHSLVFDTSPLEEPYTAGCKLAVSGTDRPHILCRDDLRKTLIYRTRSDASTWVAAETIVTDELGHPYDIAANASGRVHLAYQDPTDLALWYRVRYQGQTAWQSRKLTSSLGRAVFRVRASNNDGSDVHVLFFDEAAGELRLWSFGDFGETVHVVAELDDVGAALDVAVDAAGAARVVYWDGTLNQLRFARLYGGTWTHGVVPGISAAPKNIAMGVTTNGQVHLALIGQDNKARFLRHASGVWHETKVPFASAPNLEVSGDSIHIATRDFSDTYWERLSVTTYRYNGPINDKNCDGIPGVDADDDGVSSVESGGLDCNDLDATTGPVEHEVCGDEADNNCDGRVDEAECL